MSSATADLPSPGASTQQTASLVLDINKDQLNDFVIASRRAPGPSVIWYKRVANGWTRHVIETDPLNIEAGGDFHDIDGDGDLDIVIGGDGLSNCIWWWENPYPDFDPNIDWTRRVIKNSGGNRHHDLMFGNFDGDAAAELVYWNQPSDSTLYLVNIPSSPETRSDPWPNHIALSSSLPGQVEGLAQADLDGDGDNDIIGGGRWFEQAADGDFNTHSIQNVAKTRTAVGQLIPGGRPEVVHSPGDIDGTARWFEWTGSAWESHDLLPIKHGHSLALADINDDEHLDIFLAEMMFAASDPNYNPNARMMVLYGNSQGAFTQDIISTGIGNHESRVANLDNDCDLDILGKPYSADTPRVDVWLSNRCSLDPPENPTPTPTPENVSLTSGIVYVSSTSGGTVGGIQFADEDILAHDVAAKQWSLVFDGSDVGLGPADVDAFFLNSGGALYLSFDGPVSGLQGLQETADDSDIVIFLGTLGSETSGTFSEYFDGSDVGLSSDAEDIDGLGFTQDGQLLLSTNGNASVPGLAAMDEDLLAFRPDQTGATTSGSWTLYFDGSDVGLTAAGEDISGVWLDDPNERVYLTSSGGFSVSGAKGDDDDIFRCVLGSTGTNTVCSFGPGTSWNGGTYGFGAEKLDGLMLQSPSTTAVLLSIADATPPPPGENNRPVAASTLPAP